MHEEYIKRCFTLAKRAGKRTKLNPNVGAVLVYKNRIIGEGYHREMGHAHAEVNAINSVDEKDIKFIAHSTLYVSLEPCNHIGRTSACSHLIIEKGINHVVISCKDPHPLVNGSGINYLRSKGVKVEVGVLEKEGLSLIRPFLILNNKKRPFIILKYAQSYDGYMSRIGEQTKITTPFTQVLTHRWRSEIDAIMVGTETVVIDDPSLTTRAYVGDHPLRIVLDRTGRLDLCHKIFTDSKPTLIFTENIISVSIKNKTFIQIDFDDNLLQNIMSYLYEKEIYLVMIEGGPKLLKSFVKGNIWDEARVITSNVSLGEGLKAPTIQGELIEQIALGSDRLMVLRNNS